MLIRGGRPPCWKEPIPGSIVTTVPEAWMRAIAWRPSWVVPTAWNMSSYCFCAARAAAIFSISPA
jgi:hypothetical protein